MAISDNRKRVMPTLEDRLNGQPLAYPEAVLLTNPSNPDLRGEVFSFFFFHFGFLTITTQDQF